MILHVYIKELNIYSPDTDVFILSIRRYPDLCQNRWDRAKTQKIDLKPNFQALGPTKGVALPSFHAFSGADNTKIAISDLISDLLVALSRSRRLNY